VNTDQQSGAHPEHDEQEWRHRIEWIIVEAHFDHGDHGESGKKGRSFGGLFEFRSTQLQSTPTQLNFESMRRIGRFGLTGVRIDRNATLSLAGQTMRGHHDTTNKREQIETKKGGKVRMVNEKQMQTMKRTRSRLDCN
jgi:hypothetical protein